jgi:hypothetical protein
VREVCWADTKVDQMFRRVDRSEFLGVIEDAPASPAFREQFTDFSAFDAFLAAEAMVADKAVRMAGPFRRPGLCTLIVGDLVVDGTVDLQGGFAEGGLFVVLGNVVCRHFIGDFATQAIVDGDLTARDAVICGFGDAGLSIVGSLQTRLFIGCDIWAEVGGGAQMDYGIGYCLPTGYSDAEREAILPRHGEAATARIVAPPPKEDGYMFDAETFAELIRSGRPIFR